LNQSPVLQDDCVTKDRNDLIGEDISSCQQARACRAFRFYHDVVGVVRGNAACLAALALFTLVLSLKTDSGWIGVDIIRLIMKIGNWCRPSRCRPLRSTFPHGLVLLAFFGFPVPSKRMRLDISNRGWLLRAPWYPGERGACCNSRGPGAPCRSKGRFLHCP